MPALYQYKRLYMTNNEKKTAPIQTIVIGGKKVKVSYPYEVKVSSNKLQNQYAQALENLKNR